MTTISPRLTTARYSDDVTPGKRQVRAPRLAMWRVLQRTSIVLQLVGFIVVLFAQGLSTIEARTFGKGPR